jgi:hypothetical protein
LALPLSDWNAQGFAPRDLAQFPQVQLRRGKTLRRFPQHMDIREGGRIFVKRHLVLHQRHFLIPDGPLLSW